MFVLATPEETAYCTVHPDREATLRCNKCGRPMCVQCAVQTPVGYRCKECVRGIQDKYYTANPADDWIAAGVAAAATAIVGYILASVGIPLFFVLILAFPVGGGISEVIVRVTQKRRSRNMARVSAAGVVVGGLVGTALRAFVLYNELADELRRRGVRDIPPFDLDFVFRALTSNIGVILAIGIITAAVYTRLRMRG